MGRQEIYHVHGPILLMVPISYDSLSVSQFSWKNKLSHTKKCRQNARRQTLCTIKCRVIFEYRTSLLVWDRLVYESDWWLLLENVF